VKTYTEKLILGAFGCTGLVPFKTNVILNKFVIKELEQPKTSEPI
jgi:hypothetical protein